MFTCGMSHNYNVDINHYVQLDFVKECLTYFGCNYKSKHMYMSTCIT